MPVLPDTEEIIDGVRGVDSVVPQISEETVDRVQLVDVGFPVPQITEEMGERVLDRTLEHGILVPQIVEEVPVDIVLSTPQERVQNLVGELIVGVPVPPVLEDGLHLVPQERVLNRTREQLVDVPVPQIMEAAVENRFPEQIVNSPVPQFTEATVENLVEEQIADSLIPTRTLEQTAAFPLPQISEERVPVRSPVQIMNFPVSQNMEAYAGRVREKPLERVQHHSFVRQKRVFVDFLPLHKASKPYTGKVFTVNLRHHRDDQAFSDNSGFIKGLDKHNMPRLGNMMVPPPQINKVSWFDWKPQAAADEPLYRFHQRYSGRSGRSKLKR